MNGLLNEINAQREGILAQQNRKRNLESASASLASAKNHLFQMEALAAETAGAPGLYAAAQEVVNAARRQYKEVAAMYEEAKREVEQNPAGTSFPLSASSRDTEGDEAAKNDQRLLDTLLNRLKQHAMETGILETPLQVLARIESDHSRFVAGNGMFNPGLLARLFVNRKPDEYNVEATIKRLLDETEENAALLEKERAENRILRTTNQNLRSNVQTFKSIVQAAADRTIKGIAPDSVPLGASDLKNEFRAPRPLLAFDFETRQ